MFVTRAYLALLEGLFLLCSGTCHRMPRDPYSKGYVQFRARVVAHADQVFSYKPPWNTKKIHCPS